jgi:hypothetical protein
LILITQILTVKHVWQWHAINNTNIEIIKYLIEHCNLNVHHVNSDGETCLTHALFNNRNVGIVQYLIDCCKLNIDHKNNNKNTCLDLAYINKKHDVAKYLIEKTGSYMLFPSDKFDEWKKIIKRITCNCDRFYKVLVTGFNIYVKNVNYNTVEFLETLNPMLLMVLDDTFWPDGVYPDNKIINPMGNEVKFADFEKMVDDLYFSIPMPSHKSHVQKQKDKIDKKIDTPSRESTYIDFTKKAGKASDFSPGESHMQFIIII